MIAPRKKAEEQQPKRPNKHTKSTILSLICLVIVGLVVFFIAAKSSEETSKEENAPKREKITENKTDIPKEAAEAVQKNQKAEFVEAKPLPPQRVGELRDGYRLLPDGTLHRVLGIITNTPPKMSLADKTFNHSADVELGNLLMVEPGEDLLGDSEGMYRGFGEELDEALSEPVYYDKNDTELQRALKESVKELREELDARRKAGENIEKLMEDTRNQLKELALYKQEIEDQVREMSTDNLTQKEYEDILSAANQMLEERGIKPLELPTTLKHTIRLRKIQEEAIKKEKEKVEVKQDEK